MKIKTYDQFYSMITGDKTLTIEDRINLQEFTFPTLNEYLSDSFLPHEQKEINKLEEINIRAILIFASKFFKNTVDQFIIEHPILRSTVEYLNSSKLDEEDKIPYLYLVYLKAVLSRFDPKLEVKFYGKIPSKIFSFRQTKAEKWYSDYFKLVSCASGRILQDLGTNNAFAYLACNMVFHLMKAQPEKYYPLPGENYNETIYRLSMITVNESDTNVGTLMSDINEILNEVPFHKNL